MREINPDNSVKLHLPTEQISSLSEPPEKQEILWKDGSCILIADDDDAICAITKTALESHQCRVITASSAIEAIALYAKNKSEIRVILLDLMMPNLDTKTIIRTLKTINPNVNIILMSGAEPPDILAQDPELEIRDFIPKPFTIQSLLETLRRVESTVKASL